MTKRKLLYWGAGIVVALIGVGVARIPGGEFAQEHRLGLMVTGTAIVFIGLYLISKGSGKYPSDDTDAGPGSDQPPAPKS